MQTQNILSLMIAQFLPLIQHRIIIINPVEVENSALIAIDSMTNRPISFVNGEEKRLFSMVMGIRKALGESSRYQLLDPSGKKPCAGMTIKPTVPRMIFIQAAGQPVFQLVEFGIDTSYKVARVSETKLSKELPGAEPQHLIITESGMKIPLDWKFFSIV